MTNRTNRLCSSLSALRGAGLAGALHGNRRARGTIVPRVAAELRPENALPFRLPAWWALILALLLLPLPASGAENGDKIVNRATFRSQELPAVAASVTVTVITRTPSTARFLKYAPGVAGATDLAVGSVSFIDGTGKLTAMPLPVAVGTQTPIDLSSPVLLIASGTFHAGEPVFLQVTDLDQNLDREAAETVFVDMSDPDTGDMETLQLTESGPDTGVFIGYIQTTSSGAVARNGILTVNVDSNIHALYTDLVDGSDSSAAAALVDPFGIVFDSITGRPVDGATVELLDAATGLPATVLGDNGLAGNIYPSSVVSGSTATDAEGRTYSFNPGGYRFPYVSPGNYMLRVTPPETHTAPSTVSTARLQALPGGPFTILEPGSRGEPFPVPAGPAIRVDLPIDPKIGTLWLRKSAGKGVVSPGENLGYEVTLQNSDPVGTIFSALVTDKLPPGFRYRRGSARLNGAPVADPAISPDGSTLVFAVGDIPPKGSALIRYVVGVGAGAGAGTAVNIATATTNPPVASNAASASVAVQEPFMQSRNVVMGRVFVGACSDNPEENKKGMEGIGIYLEDGTFVITDKRGMFHFEGVASGSHVVQLDIDSIPQGYRIQPCERNSRFAGRAYSQFADLQGGTMWRTDFYLARNETANEGRDEGAGADPSAAGTGAQARTGTSEGSESGQATAASIESRYPGEIALEMISSQQGDLIEYRIPMQGTGIPLENLRLTVTLPQGATYRKGSSVFAEAPCADPAVAGEKLFYELGDADPAWADELIFQVDIDRKGMGGDLQTKATLTFDNQDAKGIAAPEVDNLLSLVREEGEVALPSIVLRPHFPTFGAELSDDDREELAHLAQVLSRFNIGRIEVTGHTDRVRIAPRSRKLYADNTALSFARAKSVGRYLAAALRLPPETLYLSGKGEREPVAGNRTEAGRSRNRRVEVKVSLSKSVESSRITLVKDRSGVKKQASGAPRKAPVVAAAIPQGEGALQPSPQAGSPGQMLMLSAAAAPPADGKEGELQEPVAAKAQAAAKNGGGAESGGTSPPEGAPDTAAASPPGKPQERVELYCASDDGVVHHRVKVVGVKEPLLKVSVTLATPKNFLYMNGTSRLSGSGTADPESTDSGLIYHFGNLSGQERFDLRLQSLLDAEVQDESTQSSVTVVISDADGNPVKSYTAAAGLSDGMEEIDRPELPPPPSPQPAAGGKEDASDSSDFEEKVIAKGSVAVAGSAAGLRVTEKEGILSPADGTILASQINAVQVVLNSSLTPVLTIDGQVIPDEKIGFKMKDRESEKTLYTYIGIDFGSAGERLLQLRGMDGFGVARLEQDARVTRTGEITSIRLVAAEGNVADGRTPVKVRIQLVDESGKPVPANAELALKGGELRPYVEPGTQAAMNAGNGTVSVDAQGWIKFQPVTASGLYHVQLAYNKATIDIESYVKPKMRNWILVGLAEGTLGYNTASGHMQNLKEKTGEDHLYDDERLAFYAKGSIKGEWLLTMSYDSDKESTGVSGNALFQDIDPNAFYTLYGDATAQGHDAASRKKLFLKVERDQFNAMFGDFDTGLSVTELSRYSRRLNGAKAEYRSNRYEITAFGSETGQSFVKDEIRGDGTSGLYRLSRKGIVANSEKISIESRDRFHSEQVTDSRPMTRFIDYSIDYEAGTIFFKAPVSSRDDGLDPVYIVADYEVADAGSDAVSYGGRAGTKFMEGALKVGGSYLHEGHVNGDSNLYGADATLALGEGTKVRAEVAGSENNTPLAPSRGSAYLAEVTHVAPAGEARAYLREQQDGFGLGQQRGSEAGTRKTGAEGTYRVNGQLALNGEAYRQYNLAGGTVRDFIDGQVSYGTKEYGSRAGLRYANDTLSDGSSATSVLGTAGGSLKLMDRRLVLRADHEQALFKKNSNIDYPTRTILGADYQATRKVLLFAQEELTFGEAADSNTTRIGVKATPWSGGTVSSSLANDMKENGERTFANVGLAQRWQLNSFWAVDGGFDHSRTIRKKAGYRFDADVPFASGGEDFSAVSLGANYQEKKLLWSNRVEYRNGETENKWGLITGVANEQGLYWGWTGRLRFLSSRTVGGNSRTDADLRLGLAYRPPVSRWIVLDRLDLVLEDEKGAGASSRGKRIINNLNANYRPGKRLQLSLQYGAKYVLEQFDGVEYSGFTDLIGIEGRYDLNEIWDVGVRASLLHSWESRQLGYSLGPSVGCNVMENAWLSLGYNLVGFRDRDFSAANYSSQGPFVQFRVKFDQDSVKDGLAVLNQ